MATISNGCGKMEAKNQRTFSVDCSEIIEYIMDNTGEEILFSYPEISSHLTSLIEGMDFSHQNYLYPNDADKLYYSDKDYTQKLTEMFDNLPRVYFNKKKILEILDEWFDENYDSEKYVTKDSTAVRSGLLSCLYEHQEELISNKY